jgi:hypothetical protein
MSRFLIVLGVLLVAGMIGVRAQPTELNTHGLIGKVKRVDARQAEIRIKNGVRKEEKSRDESSMVFDEKGRLTFETTIGEEVLEIRHTHSADGIRRTLSETKRPFDKPNAGRRPSAYATRFRYNESDNSISEDHMGGRDFGDPVIEMTEYTQRNKYIFDSSNRLAKRVIMEADLKEGLTYEYFYRAPGPPTDLVVSRNGHALQFIKYKYELDDVGNWTRRESESRSINPNHPVGVRVEYRKITYYKP